MEDLKQREVLMTDKQEFELRVMEACSGMEAGDLIGLLNKSLGARVKRLREKWELPRSSSVIIPQLINMILLNDIGVFSDEEFDREMQELAWHKNHPEWTTPEELDPMLQEEAKERGKEVK